MKYAFIENHRPLFRVEKMCRILGASKSGYYAWRGWKKTRRQEENEMILDKIKEAYKKRHGIYGSPRITTELHEKGDCYDNAVAESFFHTLKTEHVYFERYKTREEARRSIFEYIEVFYNRVRRHSTLGEPFTV